MQAALLIVFFSMQKKIEMPDAIKALKKLGDVHISCVI